MLQNALACMCWVQQLSTRCWQQAWLDEHLKQIAPQLQHPKVVILLACELHMAREVVDPLVVQ